MGFVGVDEDIAVLVVGAWFGNAHLLVPTVLAADVIGLHGKREVLVHAAVFPKNSLRVRVVALKGFDAVNVAHHPLAGFDLFQIHQRGGPTFATEIFLQPPTAEVVRTSDDAGFDTFRDPHFIDEVTDLGMNF